MNDDEKKCPDCAETIKSEARKCRFCGHEFWQDENSASSQPRPERDVAAMINKVSAEAQSKKQKKAGIGCVSVAGIIVLLVALGQCASDEPPPNDPAKLAEEAENKRKGMHCLSAWDGSHVAVVASLKDALRDPKSFEHVETRITPVDAEGNHKLIMQYRARNGFGGMNAGLASATIDNETCDASEVTNLSS